LNADKVAEVLTTGDVDVNERSAWGHTALILACDQARNETRRVAIRKFQRVDTHDKTAHVAKLTKVVSQLLTAGADPNMKDATGRTSLMYMSSAGHIELVLKLIKAGADVNSADDLGWTALHEACFWNNYRVVECLLINGARPDTPCKSLETPLHMACYNAKSEDVVRLLVTAKVNVDARNVSGITPLYIAMCHNYVSVVTMLIKVGNADYYIQDSNGVSPRDIARARVYREMEVLMDEADSAMK
jgi:ankyrin repeat protein